MAYEEDMNVFLGALATASAAAVVMPYAYPIVSLMGMLVADPAEQDRAAEQWLDRTPVDAGQPLILTGAAEREWHPPMAAAPAQESGGDLAYLRAELQRLTREIGQSGDWEGRAYNSFQEKVQLLDQHLTTLENNRLTCGNTLKCSALGFHVLMIVCVGIAGLLAALAAYVTLARATAALGMVAAVNAERQAITLTAQWHETLSTVFSNHWKLVLKISAIMSAAGIAYNQFAQDLPFLNAVPDGQPNLLEASAVWDPTRSDIVDDPQSQFDTGQLEDASFLPEIGW